jgi:hypothetical protein
MMRSFARAVSCWSVTLLGTLPSYAKEATASSSRAEARATRAPAAPASAEAGHRASSTAEPAPAIEPAPASVAEPPPADLTEQAKQLYLLGAEAFSAQRNADAIFYFRQAERLVPSAKLTYNIALAYDEMGDTGRALREYRAFLAREPSSVHRDEVQARVEQLELALAALGVQQLRIVSEPTGATVRVGEELVGITPWAGELAPGLHRIHLEHAGYRAQDTEVALSAQHVAELQVTLRAEPRSEAKRPSPLSRIQPLTWGFLGVGVGALAGGVGFELSRAASSDHASRAATPEAVARAQGASDAKQMASLLLLGAGGAFLVGGGVLLVLDLNREADDAPLGNRAADNRAAGNRAAGSSAAGTTAASGHATTAATTVSLPCGRDFCGLVTRGWF